jgi:hypothetical protein
MRARYVAAGCLIRKLMPRSDSTSPMMGIFGIEPKETSPSRPRRTKGSKAKSGSDARNPTSAKRHIMAKRRKKAKKAKKAKKTKKRRKKKKAM